ncbi:lantibiotic dehydratase family protein [Chryseobacterium wangxinyae]|uniref:lantibiotic dehydratase family protein n=1 Tax=Chryseobacterium sp. CY353 TaxID=2997334 RepID=UPI00226DA7F4|nr:lantibiotic dehydratase family protein [Chryseobacterium sp. CY353]MCY0970811.1 lantibiotic dehydratase family protein [Chryseobacterium sp. CY353]
MDGKNLIDFFLNNQEFREALYVGSKDLYQELDKAIANNSVNEKLLFSLTKYFLRSKTRCTPFGLFSNFFLGTIGDNTKILLKNTSESEKHVRVDMEVVSILIDYLLSCEDIYMNVKFMPNNTIYSIGNISFYIESQTKNKNEKEYYKSTFEESSYISSILEYTKGGKLINEISEFLYKEYEIDNEEAENFILELIKNKILCSELEVSTIDINPFATLIGRIKNFEKIRNTNIQQFIKEGELLINFYSIKNENIRIEDIKKFEKIFSKLDFTFNNVFQIDLNGKAKINELSKKTVQNANKAIEVLNLFSNCENNTFKEFKEAFHKKYEDQEISLLAILDDDLDLGYPVQQRKLLSPFLDEISFPVKKTNKYKLLYQKDIFLLRKLSQFFLETQDTNIKELTIDDTDLSFLKSINDETQSYPNTLSALAEVYHTENEEEYLYVNMFSASATNLLGRFSSADKEIENYIKEIYSKEKEIIGDDAIMAEIVHLPKYREGNVILRPSFDTYEIPILSQSLLPNKRQIQLNDLYLSIKKNRLVIRSKKLNKYILPKLSSAHNYMNPQNLSLYRFLSDFQYQDVKKNIYFDWGPIAEGFIFLPRVVYKNVILSKATWNLRDEDLKLLYSYSSDRELNKKIHFWRKKNRIPLQFVLKEFDNKLFVNTQNVFIFKMFLNTVKNFKRITLEEIIDNKHLIVKDTNGNSFTNEIILSFYKK